MIERIIGPLPRRMIEATKLAFDIRIILLIFYGRKQKYFADGKLRYPELAERGSVEYVARSCLPLAVCRLFSREKFSSDI